MSARTRSRRGDQATETAATTAVAEAQAGATDSREPAGADPSVWERARASKAEPVDIDLVRAKSRPCRFPTRSGASCRNAAIYSDNGCLHHSNDPEALAIRRKAQAKGGVNRSNAARAAKLLASDPRWSHVAERLVQALDEVMDGTLDSHRGMSVSQISRAIVQLVDTAEAVAKLEALEAEIAALRETPSDSGETFLTKHGKEMPDEEDAESARLEGTPIALPYEPKGVN